MKRGSLILIIILSALNVECQKSYPNKHYSYSISPIIGINQWSKTAIDIGISSEHFSGIEFWGGLGGGERNKPIQLYFAYAQSLSAEVYLLKDAIVIPKYSIWIHSKKMSIFYPGLNILYRSENGIFIRPEWGIIFPKKKMRGLLGFKYLRLKISYGYNITFNHTDPLRYNNISVLFYFGNNTGGLKSYR